MGKPDALVGTLDLLVLRLLSRQPDLHGYAIMAAIEARSGAVLRAEEGSLYPALHRMEEAGWLEATWRLNDTGRRTRVYRLPRKGDRHLAAEWTRWRAVSTAVNRLLRSV